MFNHKTSHKTVASFYNESVKHQKATIFLFYDVGCGTIPHKMQTMLVPHMKPMWQT